MARMERLERKMIKADEFAGISQKIELLNSIREVIDPEFYEVPTHLGRSNIIQNLYFVMIEDLSLENPDPERLEFVGIGESERNWLQEAAIILFDIAKSVGFSTENMRYISHCKWPEFLFKAQITIKIMLIPR